MSCFSEAWGELDEALVMDFHFPSFLRNLLACFKSVRELSISMGDVLMFRVDGVRCCVTVYLALAVATKLEIGTKLTRS
eukprot:765518-Hanusia_phi.AAC.9